MARSKDEIRGWLDSCVGGSVSTEDGDLRGQCVSLIKGVMALVGVPNPRAGRGNAAQAGDAYIREGIGVAGRGWLTVCINRQMAYPYGHIWVDIQGEGNWEQNGAVPLRVTKNTRPLSQAQQLVSFDQWVAGGPQPPEIKPPEEDEMIVRLQDDGSMYVVSAAGKRYLGGPEGAAWVQSGAKVVDIDRGTFDSIQPAITPLLLRDQSSGAPFIVGAEGKRQLGQGEFTTYLVQNGFRTADVSADVLAEIPDAGG